MRRAIQLALLAAVYFAAAKLSLLLAIPPGYATAVWPPSGIALGALLLAGTALWPGIWFGSFAANLTIEGDVLAAAIIASGSSLQAYAIATLIMRHVGVPRRFLRVRETMGFVSIIAVGAVIAPTLALLPLAAVHPLPVAELGANWWTWWQGDACGMLIFTPLILSWSAPGIAWTGRKVLEAMVFAALLLAAGYVVFTGGAGRTFVMVPFVVWAAFRFGQREVTTTAAAICGMALWYTLRRDSGPFADLVANEALLLLLVFVSTVVVTGLMLCAVLAQLEDARTALATRVAERTRAAAESEQRFRLMVDSVVDYAIYMLDAQGRVASWNAGAERIKGYRADEIIGQHFSRFYLPEDIERGKPQAELELARSQGRFEEEAWRVRKDGSTFWASIVVSAVRDDEGELLGFAKVTRDLTDKKHVEAAIVRAKIEAERANESKSHFLANMSHELRTPLNSLLILARLLADNAGGRLDAKEVRFAQTIYASGMDLLGLINDLLDLAKIEAGAITALHMGPARLEDLRDDLERAFREMAREKGVEFAIDLAPGLPATMRTDPTRVKQVLKNLLANAFKFTRQGSVRLRIAPRGPDVVAFAVSDTGIGIAPDKREIIFQAFQQADGATSRQYGGTGLGLSISRELTRLLGGELELESTPGRGSTFTLVLPVSDVRAAASVK
ncbi:MAG: MASE1 domain-containing protein [Betaproteobacteria bacterium]|nr:MASE1 domain-containing protein [Betaproteobacteria bacterium]